MKNFEMNNNLSVNHINKTIEITKQMNAAASKFGSEAAVFLDKVRVVNPDYRIVVKQPRKGGIQKGLTYKYMETYIKDHAKDDSIMRNFNILRGKAAPDGRQDWDTSIVASYLDVRDWFLAQFPEIEEYRKNARNGIMDILNAA